MMGQNRKRLTNRPRYNPRIESPDFLLTNSVSNLSFESTFALLNSGSRDGEHSKKRQGRTEGIQEKRKLRSRTSDPASRQRDAIETYIRRYVTSAPAKSKRPKEDDEITTGPRVRLTDNVKIVFDEDRYRKSLSTTHRPESSIIIRNFSSIHHIADHKKNVCDETFRNRFTKSETRKDDRKFDVKRVLAEGNDVSNVGEDDDGKHILISKALGSNSDEFMKVKTDVSKSLHPMTTQDEHVKSLLNGMRKSNTGLAGKPEKIFPKSQRNLFRIDGIRVSENNTNYDEFARDFSEFPQSHPIENTTDTKQTKTDASDIITRNGLIMPDHNHMSSPGQNHNSDSSLEQLALSYDHISSSSLSSQIVKSNENPELAIRDNGTISKVEEHKSGRISESSLRIALRIPSAEDPEVTDNRYGGHVVVQADINMSSALSDSEINKDDSCFSCPMCVAQREMEEKQKRIKDESFIRPDSLRAPSEEDMDFRSSAIFDSRPSLTPPIPEGVELKHVEAYDITTLSGNARCQSDDDESKGLKTEYRLSLKHIKKDKSSPTLPLSPKSDGKSFYLQGTELQPQDRFSFISESPIAGFPKGFEKQYPIPEFRPSPIYSRKWVVEKSSPSRNSLSSSFPDTAYPSGHAGVSGKAIGVSVPRHDSIENEILNIRVPFLIWRNKQKKENIASMKDNCNGSTINLNHRPGNSPSSKAAGGGGEDRTMGKKKLTLAEQALLSQRIESDRKTAFPCPPNSPAPEQLVDLIQELHEEDKESLSQSHLQDSTCANDIPV